MIRKKLLILGAGPTGLGAALHAADLGETDFLVLDASHHAGGLASSFTDRQGFTWDLGAHVQFSHYKKHDEFLDRALPASQWVTHRRSTWIWTKQRFVPYPFQLNLHRLRRDDRWSALRGLLRAQKSSQVAPQNFAEWITATCGEGIAEQFLRPYNEKIWAVSLETMSAAWVAERVSSPKSATAIRRRTSSTGSAATNSPANSRPNSNVCSSPIRQV